HRAGAKGVLRGPAQSESETQWSWLHASLCHAILPATTVANGPPRNLCPSNGEFLLFEEERSAENVHSLSTSKIVTSAIAPSPSCPRPSFKMPLGPVVNSAIILSREILPG